MRQKICLIKNVARLAEAGDALIRRAPGLPGMGLIWGPTGYGKSTATTWFVNQCHGVYVRARADWKSSAMLTSILRELDVEPCQSNWKMVDLIIEKLAQYNRPLFIDEADYLLSKEMTVETLRDIHDLATVPVILIGMDGIQRKIVSRQQLAGRLAQWVEFRGADLDDARTLADGVCEVPVEDDLLESLHHQACAKRKNGEVVGGAEVRRLVVGLNQIEAYARQRHLKAMDLKSWPRGRSFFLGDAPAPQHTAVVSLASAG